MFPSSFSSNLLFVTLLLFTVVDGREEQRDAIEGDTIRLECRYNLQMPQVHDPNKKWILLWQRTNALNQTDTVAVMDNSLESDYELAYDASKGQYDLIVRKARYDRDNGLFVCQIKQAGTGSMVKSVSHMVTILISPGMPVITPSAPVAIEGEPYLLKCSSEGGSPDPVIEWYRNGVLLDGEREFGGVRTRPTTNTLTIVASKEDDGVKYRCTVWNRATSEGRKLESQFYLTVHYKPRIQVGPFNPLSVSVDGNADMACQVTANPTVRSVRWMKDGQILSVSKNHTILRVKPEDSGFYDCIADNGIGGPAKESLELVVLHGPHITVPPSKEVSTGNSVNVRCNIKSNPKPHTIIWYKENDQFFKRTGPELVIHGVTSKDTGNYICSATTTLKPSGSIAGIEKTKNATMVLQVRHVPGKAEITPQSPVAVAGKPFTLTCGANPPGFPAPEYRWWKGEGSDKRQLEQRSMLTFTAVGVTDEGRYYCQAKNSLGEGVEASIYLSVNQPAEIVHPMKPEYIEQEGNEDFKLTCYGKGKPRPKVTWTHNEVEINPQSGDYRIDTKENDENGDVKMVISTLFFEAMARKGAKSLSANDRGVYACHFTNEIGDTAKSETRLHVKHSPVVRHTYNRVAFDADETAVLQCKMSSYPEPKFEWVLGGKQLDNDTGERYKTNITELPNDIFVGALTIRNIRESDYGDYTCRAYNAVGDDDEKTIIKLVKKSAPETPVQLEMLEVLADSITLRWVEGFNGGFSNTEFIVNYNDRAMTKNESCRTLNPCKITGLESRHEYDFRVVAVNPRGYSHYSDKLTVVTKVNLKDMPSAGESSYDRERNILVFHVEPSDVALRLVAKIEIRSEASQQWSPLTSVQVLSDIETVYLKSTPEQVSDIRVILCLQSNQTWCGYEHLVKMDSVHSREAKVSATDHLWAVITFSVICAVSVIFVILCCCKKGKSTPEKKDFESDTSNERTNKNAVQSYFSSHDNKGLMADMDNGNINNKLTSSIYGSTMGPMAGHIPQNYYLTGDGHSDPSPNGSNETGQTEFWNSIKSNMLHDNMNESEVNYNAGYMVNPQMIDPNGYLNAYPTYYPAPGYQPLDEESINRKNMNMSFYDEMNGNAYGATMGMDMMAAANDTRHYNTDELDYPPSRARVMSEIIV